jgi:glycosyltransferase involved in cell wall biosynthesis
MVDIGLMKKGPSYYLLKWFERYQYRLADFIGVQSPGNQKYIEKLKLPNLKKLEVLPNWMPSTSTRYRPLGNSPSHANLAHTILCGKKVLIYAGNLGEAQGIENFAKTLLDLRDHDDYGFLIIGRGSKKEWLQEFIDSHRLKNALLLDEVDLKTLDMYYRQCYGGLVFLDAGHRTHNIPGKFISYLEAGLPVVACVNPGNDLVRIILSEGLGMVVEDPNEFSKKLGVFLHDLSDYANYRPRARAYYEKHYRPDAIAEQIITSITAL